MNVPPMRTYATRLVARSAAPMAVTDCAMFGGTRVGYCRLNGAAPSVSAFIAGLALVPAPADVLYGDDTCLALPGFGTTDGVAFEVAPGVTRWVAGPSLPHNDDNVHVVSFYATATSVCVEMEYPYG